MTERKELSIIQKWGTFTLRDGRACVYPIIASPDEKWAVCSFSKDNWNGNRPDTKCPSTDTFVTETAAREFASTVDKRFQVIQLRDTKHFS